MLMKSDFWPIITLFPLLCTCGGPPSRNLHAAMKAQPIATAVPKKDGVRVFEQHCAGCHGADGTAGIGGAANLKQLKLDDAAIRRSILKGKGIMPPFENKLPQRELTQVIHYLKVLKNDDESRE